MKFTLRIRREAKPLDPKEMIDMRRRLKVLEKRVDEARMKRRWTNGQNGTSRQHP